MFSQDLVGGGEYYYSSIQYNVSSLLLQYRDPLYSGGSIGEYQYYDWMEGTWDESTCRTDRCAQMDCHAVDTHFELLGVFKETDGIYDWAEQLFKHQGYCLWNGDKEDSGDEDDNDGNQSSDYQFMQNNLERWTEGCQQTNYQDTDGNRLYMGVQPKQEGRMSFAIYLDGYCRVKSDISMERYIEHVYTEEEGYSEQEAQDTANSMMKRIDRWNNLMNSYKVCNPCRAYNKVAVYDGDRRLNEDGEGDDEQWGFNCYGEFVECANCM